MLSTAVVAAWLEPREARPLSTLGQSNCQASPSSADGLRVWAGAHHDVYTQRHLDPKLKTEYGSQSMAKKTAKSNGKRKKYTDEQRKELVERMTTEGAAAVAKATGVAPSLLYLWRSRSKSSKGSSKVTTRVARRVQKAGGRSLQPPLQRDLRDAFDDLRSHLSQLQDELLALRAFKQAVSGALAKLR